jgi:hypothetical protein
VISQDNANLFWDNTNKRLGIGTSSPILTLDIRAPYGINLQGDQSAIQHRQSDGTLRFLTGLRNDVSPGNFVFYSYGNNWIFYGGNVGIGTTDPVEKLTVMGNIRTTGNLQTNNIVLNDGSSWRAIYLNFVNPSNGKWMVFDNTAGGNPDGAFIFRKTDGSLVLMKIETWTGNVGIGTSSPAEKLHVIGNVRIDDAYKLLWSDVNLYRAAADVLKTNDNFDALALRISGTEVIDASRNLKNIASSSISDLYILNPPDWTGLV